MNIIVDQIFNFTKILILQSMIRRILVKANEFHLFKTSIFLIYEISDNPLIPHISYKDTNCLLLRCCTCKGILMP